jgi:transcriptional regulator with XRE-family HTH domain
MSMFSKKHIVSPVRVGNKLNRLRLDAGVSVQELAHSTKLQAEYILAIESNAFHRLPSETIYRKLFLKRYATGLGADPAPYVAQYLAEEVVAETPTQTTSNICKSRLLSYTPTLGTVLGSVVLGLFFTGYFGTQLHALYQPPTLELTAPLDEERNETGMTTIAGVTDPEVAVFINGEQVRSGTDGTFATDIDLQPGVNTILVSAKKRHGTESNIIKYVVYNETSQVSYASTGSQLTTN